MKQHIEAVYENGVLRPLEPVQLRDFEQVTITIHDRIAQRAEDEWLDMELVAAAQSNGDPTVTIEEVRAALSTIEGSLSDAVIAERGEY